MPWIWQRVWQNDEAWEPPSPRSVFRFADEDFFQQNAPHVVDLITEVKEEPEHDDQWQSSAGVAECTAGSSSCSREDHQDDVGYCVGSNFSSWTRWNDRASAGWGSLDDTPPSLPGLKYIARDSCGKPLIFESTTWPKPKPMPKKRKGSEFQVGSPIGAKKTRTSPQ